MSNTQSTGGTALSLVQDDDSNDPVCHQPPSIDDAKKLMMMLMEGGMPRRKIAGAYMKALKELGLPAEPARVYKGGRYPKTLSLVIATDCPRDHVDETGENFAKVLLVVDPSTGWVSLHEDSCPSCSIGIIERWLVVCRSCAEKSHPPHTPFCITPDCWGGMEDQMRPDDSPLGRVLWVISEVISGKEDVKELGLKSKDQPPSMTVEETAEWLDSLEGDDGPLVAVTWGVNRAWEAVTDIDGCPTQEMIRKAQALRKSRP